MAAAELLYDLLAAGFSLRSEGDRIIVAPFSRLTPQQKRAIVAYKPDLLRLLDPEPKRMGIYPRCGRFGYRPAHSPNRGWQCTPCRRGARTTARPTTPSGMEVAA